MGTAPARAVRLRRLGLRGAMEQRAVQGGRRRHDLRSARLTQGGFVESRSHRFVVGFEGRQVGARARRTGPMRFVLFNFVDPDDAMAYYALTPEEQQADVERHFAWFRTHRDHIVGGEELDEPA